MDTKNVIARFEAERQALAMMDHPNIAKVLDANATESGRPYFVMELIRGIKITDYCDAHSLTTVERLNLFVEVCQAVQHAHQKGIIHRDLKPSNILVTTTLEGTALPVVIDFGIAKATTNQRLTDKTLFTAFDMLIGTPAYMSPEQAVLTSVDVDTRTDIYSLGVLLYELLTGVTPFDAGELMKAGLDEVRRVIREREPVRPSSRLSKMTKDDLTTIAHHRKAEPPRLIRAVHGDLDWIVMKALEKDRTRRYETANGLAMDIKRYLSDETISARPPSAFYRFQKTVARHKTLFIGIGTVAALLVLGLILISLSLARERGARLEADAALLHAKAEAAKSRQETRFLEDMLQSVGPSVALGRDTKMLREILDKTAVRIGTEMADQPATQAELQDLIGRVYVQLGAFDQAEAMHRAALDVERTLFGNESREVGDSLNYLGRALFRENNLPEAELVFRQALEVRRKVLGREHLDVAATMKDLAGVYYFLGRTAESEAMTQAALDMRRKLLGDDNLVVADSLNALSILWEDENKFAEAEKNDRQVLALRRKLLGGDHPLVASSLNNLGGNLTDQYKLAQAESCIREALALRLRLSGAESVDYARCLLTLSFVLKLSGRTAEAELIIRKAYAIDCAHSNDETNPRNVNSLWDLAVVWGMQGRLTEAESALRQVFELQRKTVTDVKATEPLESLVTVLALERKFGEAERILTEYYVVDFPGKSPAGEFFALRADYLASRSRWSEAATDAALALQNCPAEFKNYDRMASLFVETRAIEKYRELCGKILKEMGHSTTAFIVDRMALDCLVLPSAGVDLKSVDQMVATANHAGLEENSLHYHQCGRALSEYRQGRFAQAVEWAQLSVKDVRPALQGMSYAVLAMAHQQLGQKDDARTTCASGEEAMQHILAPRGIDDFHQQWKEGIFARALMSEAMVLVQPAPGVERDREIR